MSTEQDKERQALTPGQRSIYYEAVDCGATHDDAMEAAHTNGYTTMPPTEPEDAAYEAWCAEQDAMCNTMLVIGPEHDPSGTSCELENGHDGKHEGPHPIGDGRIKWTGGGMCAGDPLPVRNVEHFIN